MTARDNFDIEKEAAKLVKAFAENEIDELDLANFGRRCQDAAYEKAANIAYYHSELDCGVHINNETAGRFVARNIKEKILALKTTEVGK